MPVFKKKFPTGFSHTAPKGGLRPALVWIWRVLTFYSSNDGAEPLQLSVCDAITARCLCIAQTVMLQDVCPSVCLSVRLSITRRYYGETAKYVINFFSDRAAIPF